MYGLTLEIEAQTVTDSCGDPSKFAELNRRADFINANSNRNPHERELALEVEQKRIERWRAEHDPAGTSGADHLFIEERASNAKKVMRGRVTPETEHLAPRSDRETLRTWRSYDSDRSSRTSKTDVDYED
jgi:hypothetical protein